MDCGGVGGREQPCVGRRGGRAKPRVDRSVEPNPGLVAGPRRFPEEDGNGSDLYGGVCQRQQQQHVGCDLCVCPLASSFYFTPG